MSATAATALADVSAKGAFQRSTSAYRNFIESSSSEYPPVSGRYHLYISLACPWAHRCYAMLQLKGLQKHIGVSIVHPTWQVTKPGEDAHSGWVFRHSSDHPVVPTSGNGAIPCTDCIPDTIYGVKTVRALYDMSEDTLGRYTVPVLMDTLMNRIVNNESSEIIRMFNSAFNSLEGVSQEDYYPENLRAAIDAVNEWIYTDINNGVYKCGFAKSQEAYNEAVTALYAALDRVEAILSKQRYIASNDRITEADIRLYMTLIRFDEVYIVYFKCSKRAIREFPNIQDYMRELYQIPQLKASTNIDHIKAHYFTSHATLNPFSIIPADSGTVADLSKPHNRSRF